MNFFFYRPDLAMDNRINPDLLYTLKGQNFKDWQREKSKMWWV